MLTPAAERTSRPRSPSAAARQAARLDNCRISAATPTIDGQRQCQNEGHAGGDRASQGLTSQTAVHATSNHWRGAPYAECQTTIANRERRRSVQGQRISLSSRNGIRMVHACRFRFSFTSTSRSNDQCPAGEARQVIVPMPLDQHRLALGWGQARRGRKKPRRSEDPEGLSVVLATSTYSSRLSHIQRHDARANLPAAAVHGKSRRIAAFFPNVPASLGVEQIVSQDGSTGPGDSTRQRRL